MSAKKAARARSYRKSPKVSQDVIDHKGRRCARTFAALATELGVTEEEVRLLVTLDKCPGRGAGHFYDIEKWRQFALDAAADLESLKVAEPGATAENKKLWETRKIRAQAKREELRESVERGDLVNREEVIQFLGEVMSEMSRQLVQVPKARASDLSGLTVPEFTKRIGEIHREILEDVAKAVSSKKKAFWQKCSAMLSDLRPSWSPGGGQSDT